MFKFILVLLFVYSVSALTSFIKEGQRAELFEILDDEISVFRVTIPEDEHKDLIAKCQYPNPYVNLDWNNLTEEAYQKYKAEFPERLPFKTKNATLSVEIKGEKKSFKKVTFSLGGASSRSRGRQAFNLKIRGNDVLYGRSQFRLRSDANDATSLRSKLGCDIHNRLGLVSVSANYISLYLNDEYLGLYVIMDAPKASWAKIVYDDGDTKNLYKCKEAHNDLSVQNSSTGCINENDEITENPEWIEFLTTLDNAKSAEDIEDIFDVDQFLYEIAYEYLVGSWDRYLYNGHNFNVYKIKNGKWIMISYDFDADFGQNVDYICIYPHITNSTDYPTYSFDEWLALDQHLIDILILKDRTRFDNIIKKFVTEAFNPTLLFPRIDELKEFIRSEKVRERTPDENGNLPGFINKLCTFDYSLEQWDANTEFTTVTDYIMSTGYGLKYWILMKYRYVCKAYDIDCDPTYMDENYQFPIDKNVEAVFKPYDFASLSNKNQPPQNTTSEVTNNALPNVQTTITITSTLTATATSAPATTTIADINATNNEAIEVDAEIEETENDSDSNSELN